MTMRRINNMKNTNYENLTLSDLQFRVRKILEENDCFIPFSLYNETKKDLLKFYIQLKEKYDTKW